VPFPRSAVPLACLTLLAHLAAAPSTAQQPAPTAPSLQEILIRLQENYWDYLATVPDFFADEHVNSVLKQEGARDVKTTTDSVFRLQRVTSVGEGSTFNESREVKLVNKKAASGDQLHGPAIFTGGFSTAGGVVSLEMSRCYDYTLEPPAEFNKAPALLIDFILKRDLSADDNCPAEKESGRAWFDPVTLHPLRVEVAVPSHRDNNGLRVLWTWSVEYAPVTFDTKQFWMPRTITSNAEANDASGTWLFTATYSNYHKLNVSSRIITEP
jgi:hypothetical protein